MRASWRAILFIALTTMKAASALDLRSASTSDTLVHRAALGPAETLMFQQPADSNNCTNITITWTFSPNPPASAIPAFNVTIINAADKSTQSSFAIEPPTLTSCQWQVTTPGQFIIRGITTDGGELNFTPSGPFIVSASSSCSASGDGSGSTVPASPLLGAGTSSASAPASRASSEASVSPPDSTVTGGSKLSGGAIAGIIVSCVALLGLAALALHLSRRYTSKMSRFRPVSSAETFATDTVTEPVRPESRLSQLGRALLSPTPDIALKSSQPPLIPSTDLEPKQLQDLLRGMK